MPPNPVKPFPSYRWRWLSANASEGLLRAPVFLGVLRALSQHEGEPFTSLDLRDDLERVENETGSTVTLARDPTRNLFRNMGQYWRGTGLLSRVSGVITLTPLGRRVAVGNLTSDDFATLMVQQTTLPNRVTYSEAEQAEWDAAGLQVRPLLLIMQVVAELGRPGLAPTRHGVSVDELIRIIVPLAGAKTPAGTTTPPDVIAGYLRAFRAGTLDITGWPNCAPDTNDARLAREFLLFLSNFGFLRREPGASNLDDVFVTDIPLYGGTVAATFRDMFDDVQVLEAAKAAQRSELRVAAERQRRMGYVMTRPGQARFRQQVLNASGGVCLLSGELLPTVLEAAHIIPVSADGADDLSNGLCMRIDLHRLYDAGDLQIMPDGEVRRSDALMASAGYGMLPANVPLPAHVGIENLSWRMNYG